MYAVIRSGGKQQRVSEGQRLAVVLASAALAPTAGAALIFG